MTKPFESQQRRDSGCCAMTPKKHSSMHSSASAEAPIESVHHCHLSTLIITQLSAIHHYPLQGYTVIPGTPTMATPAATHSTSKQIPGAETTPVVSTTLLERCLHCASQTAQRQCPNDHIIPYSPLEEPTPPRSSQFQGLLSQVPGKPSRRRRHLNKAVSGATPTISTPQCQAQFPLEMFRTCKILRHSQSSENDA